MNVPFISITDFTKIAEVERMLTVFQRRGGARSGRKLGVGVMMSHSTLNDLPSRYTEVFPNFLQVANIFSNSPYVFNVLHYADYRGIDVQHSLTQAAHWGGHDLHAIQLDMTWPDPYEIKRFRGAHLEVQLILQVGSEAFSQIENDPVKLVDRLESYGDCFEYVLLDLSMGQGRQLNAERLKPFIYAIMDELPEVGIVVAGGLGPNTLDLIGPLLAICPNLSIDAQGRLKDNVPDDPDHCIAEPNNWDKAEAYLTRALEKFAAVKA